MIARSYSPALLCALWLTVPAKAQEVALSLRNGLDYALSRRPDARDFAAEGPAASS